MAFTDKIGTSDLVEAKLSNTTPALHPCPECGKETLEHRGPPGTRICSAATCRHVIEPPKE